jgi:hypothetical protein
MEVYLGLPVKALVIAMLLYYFFFSNWFESILGPGAPGALEIPPREVALDVVRFFFLIYVALNVAGASQVQRWVISITNARHLDLRHLPALIQLRESQGSHSEVDLAGLHGSME